MEAGPQINSAETEKADLKERIDFVFEQNPDLMTIGTKEQYSAYLETIFPESKFKEIVYHNSNAQFKDEGFKSMNPNFDTLNSIADVYNFSTNRQFTKRYGKNVYSVVLNIHDPIRHSASGEYVDHMDGPLSEALFRIGKQKAENPFSPAYDESLKDTDAVINRISGEEYIAQHPVSGAELGIPAQTIVSVFNRDQIHILGSTSDLQKFKQFIDSN